MRQITELKDHWLFARGCGDPSRIPEESVPVTLPHTWNAVDGHDGHDIAVPAKDWSRGDLKGAPAEHYARESCWYFRPFVPPEQPLPGGRVYVEIPAAGLQAVIYVNGRKAAEHEGGFSAFRAEITDLCGAGENLLAINVSNEYRSHVYPQHADFTFYGGLYRGVRLISAPAVHFDLDDYGGPGITVNARPEKNCAVFDLQARVTGAEDNYTVLWTVLDPDGREAAGGLRPSGHPALSLTVPDARLWSPDSPALYTVLAQLIRRNEVVDEVSLRTGVRSFACTPDGGFFLNGQSLPLRGVCRHQDRLYEGNALTREEHREDARLIKELGANAIRLAHYQHSQDFYDACDELGFVVWAEIPFITIMNEDPAAHENCRSQMRELIIQNAHHPCICFWGLSNEVTLGGDLTDQLVENHRDLEKLVKSLDPTRLTTLAHVSNTPEDCGLHGITDVEAYNHYFGWYGGSMEQNEACLDRYHAAHPDRCLAVSEYGAEGILTYHSRNPEVKDYSEDYQTLYHEHMAAVFMNRPWIWGSFVWNMFDFGAAARNEGGVAGRNNKGLMTLDRKIKKDSYYIYQAYWTREPMVHLCGRRYAQRAGETTEIRVYSNQPVVRLTLNGEPAGEKAEEKVFVFTVSLREGLNTLTAFAGAVSDTIVLERVEKEPEIYTLPSVKLRRRMREELLAGIPPEALEGPLAAPEGYWSVKERISVLAAEEKTRPILEQAVFLAFRLGEYAKTDVESMLSRFPDMPLGDLETLKADSRLLHAINWKLNQILR